MCRYDFFFTGTLIFKEQFIYLLNLAKIILCNSDETGFLFDCPSLMLRIVIRCIQHSQAIVERDVCEPAHSFFHFIKGIFEYRQFNLKNLLMNLGS